MCSKRSITKSLLMPHNDVPLVTEFHSVRQIFKHLEIKDDTNKQGQQKAIWLQLLNI